MRGMSSRSGRLGSLGSAFESALFESPLLDSVLVFFESPLPDSVRPSTLLASALVACEWLDSGLGFDSAFAGSALLESPLSVSSAATAPDTATTAAHRASTEKNRDFMGKAALPYPKPRKE